MAKIIDYTIVISRSAGATEKRAAALLREKIKVICGKKLPLVTDDAHPVPLEIVVGKTNREELDGLDFQRAARRFFEFVLQMQDKRLYIVGLGVDPGPLPYTSPYVVYNDGQISTAYGVYWFIEKILGCNMMFAANADFTEKPDLEIPEGFRFYHTTEALQKQLPERIDGAAMYLIPTTIQLEWPMECVIFKTGSGKFIVVDGGREDETDHVLRCLEHLAEGKKPVVSAWLFSHVHDDHYGVYKKLCEDPAFGSRVTVEHFYCHLLSEEFYLTTSREPNPEHVRVRNILLNSEKTLGARVHTVNRGDVIRAEEFAFEVLRIPSEERAADMNMNDSSVVYRLNYNDQQTMVLLGDAEWVCSNELIETYGEALKSDAVQIGHHGVGNVSEECYRLIGADFYLWQNTPRVWYSDGGSGLHTRNIGVPNTMLYISQAGGKPENQFRDMEGILSLPLPITGKGE